MRWSVLSPARVEQFFGALRLIGTVVGVAVLVLVDFPEGTHLGLLWAVQGLLVIGTAALWWWRLQMPSSTVLLHAGFALDSVVVAGYVLGLAHVSPHIAWALVFTLLVDAALRYGVLGSVLGYLLALALFVVQGELHSAAGRADFGVLSYLYVAGTLGGIAGVLAAFSHVVEQQTAVVREQALRLAAVQQMRERLVTLSSHELRGPLAAIVTGVQTVALRLEQLGPDRARAILDEVLLQTTHVQRLGDDLLAVARAQSEDVRLRPEPGDLADTVRLAVAAAQRHRVGHRLQVNVRSTACVLDHERVQQVVRNLVENAFKYTPAEGEVSVSAKRQDGQVELRVADSGPGIPADERPRVFEPFRRRPRAGVGETDVGGLGMGLYLVRQIVDAMGGSIELLSSPAGSEFVVRLPLPAQVGDRGPVRDNGARG